jgi:hypothetical protein
VTAALRQPCQEVTVFLVVFGDAVQAVLAQIKR